MRMVDLIRKKRDGGTLSDEEIRFLISGYTAGDIPDYQMSAFLMAVLFRGMDRHETAVLTDAMMHSGDTVDLGCFGHLSVDKHSTGPVADKTTPIVARIVASLGGKLAKMSGRGLGHTGGTVDKLESIPGFRTTLTSEEFIQQVHDVGVAVIGQSGNLTPADKKLYALRDVTATVDSLPLIASSIMSKKLAAGSRSIVLDVKVGSGAFMKTLEDARALAEEMVELGKSCGRRPLQHGHPPGPLRRQRPGGHGGRRNSAGRGLPRPAGGLPDPQRQHAVPGPRLDRWGEPDEGHGGPGQRPGL